MYYARNRKGMHEPGEIFLLPPSRNMRHRIVLAFPISLSVSLKRFRRAL